MTWGTNNTKNSRPQLIFLLSFLVDLGLSSINFGVPLYAVRLGAPQYLIGLIASAFGLSYIVSAAYSTKTVFGRKLKTTLCVLLIIYSIICGSYLLVRHPWVFIAIRALEGFTLGNLYPLADTLPASRGGEPDLVPWYNAGWALSYIVAPILLGYMLTSLGFASPFGLAVASSLASCALILLVSGELGLENTTSMPPPENGWRLKATVSDVALPAFISGVVTSVFSSLYPAYLAGNHVPYELIGVVVGSMATSRTVILASAGRIQARLGPTRVALLGYILSASIAIPTVFHSLATQLVCALLVGGGVGLLYHAGLTNSLKNTGRFQTSTLEASLGSGFFSGPLIGAAISELSPTYVYLGVSIIPLASFLRVLRAREHNGKTV